MEQDEQVICTIKIHSNKSSNKDLITQNEGTKVCYSHDEHGKQFYTEEEKMKKSQKIPS